MIKNITITILTIASFKAVAQKTEYAPIEPTRFSLKADKAPIYRKLTDTTKVAYHLPKSEGVLVIGQASPEWAVIKRAGFPYYINQRYLLGARGADAAAVVASANAPMPVDPETGLISYTEVVQAPGLSQQELYSRAYEWVAKAYNSANNVVQMHDKESGKIIVKGLSRVSAKSYDAGTVKHTLSIYVKDGRYKYVLTDFTHEAPIASTNKMLSGGPLEQEEVAVFPLGSGKKLWAEIKRDAAQDAATLVADLKVTMAAKHLDPSDF